MKRIGLFFVISGFIGPFFPAKAQQQHGDYNKIYTAVEQEPEFPGGEVAFYKFLAKNIHYIACQSQNITGRIIILFIIEKDGSLSNIKCEKPSCPESDFEVKRVMNLSPKWKPGKIHNKVVRVRYEIPMYIDPQQEDQ